MLSIAWSVEFCFFFFNDTATTEIYTLSLHDALPICCTSFEIFNCSTLTTWAGITRNTAIGPLRSRAAFTRNRASPAISYAKSESPVSFHSPRLRSGMPARSISSSCAVLIGGVSCRFISPCVRKMGGSPTRRCRSEEADCTSFLSSSPRARSAPLYWGAAKSAGRPAAPRSPPGWAASRPSAPPRWRTIGRPRPRGRDPRRGRRLARRSRAFRGHRRGARGILDPRHNRRQPPPVRHDPHAHHTPVRYVLELGLRHLVDVVRRLGRRYLDEQRVDMLIGERLPAHLPRLAILHHGHGLIRQEVQLIALLPEQDVDERIDPRCHGSAQWARVQHVRAVDVMGRRVRPDGEEGIPGGVEVVEQARVVLGQLGARPASDRVVARQDELDAEHPRGREPGRFRSSSTVSGPSWWGTRSITKIWPG